MNVSRAVAGLRRKRLIDVGPDPSDRRVTVLTATQRGEQLGEDISARERSMYDHVFDVLSEEEVQVLDSLLARVNTGLDERELREPPRPTRDWLSILSE